MNKTHQEQCDENLQLRNQLEAAQASTNIARLAARQAVAKAEALEQERDALAAHLDRLKRLLEYADEIIEGYWGEEDPQSQDIKAALNDTPETSLAQRDAQMKVVMLEHVISMMPRRATIEAQLDWLVGENWEIQKQLRRRADGGDE